MLEERLIKEIQQNECLWNKYNPDYKNKRKKDICWTSVSNNVGETVEVCRKRWKSLRDRFIIELSARTRACGNGNSKKDWLFFEQLFFLTTSMTPKGSQSAPLLNTMQQSQQAKSHNSVDKKDKQVDATKFTVAMGPPDAERYANLDETFRTLVENYLNFVNTYKQTADPFLAVIQEFFEKVPQHRRTAFKMEILNYTYKMYAELKD
uniref:Transcription factor Adf-1 n=1 Tax=Ceratitis capitata TaxID=7213 RepID=W8CB88_CERCA